MTDMQRLLALSLVSLSVPYAVMEMTWRYQGLSTTMPVATRFFFWTGLFTCFCLFPALALAPMTDPAFLLTAFMGGSLGRSIWVSGRHWQKVRQGPPPLGV